ncbi:arginine deiminase family protein [Nocardioides humi]|uniref:arginine deiminase family protein n=1 Tax=Nocardioides humi TaxID=449461 RepID=UPI00319D9C00
MLHLIDLLAETLADPDARDHVIETTTDGSAGPALGDAVRDHLRGVLGEAAPEELTRLLVAGIRNDELRGGRAVHSLVTSLLPPQAFLVDPLPNLLFTRDSSVWLPDRVLVTTLAMRARRRESQLTGLVYRFHPRFAGGRRIEGHAHEHVEGGDVLLLAPGVVALGVGERTTPAGAERLARQLLTAGLATTVLAVPIAQERATMHLDTVCTMVDVDRVVMYPGVADTLTAYAVTAREPGSPELVVAPPEPFLAAAAKAMGIERLHRIDTGLDPVTAEREQWDDGNNTLALEPGVAVAYERNDATNARLEEAGIEVLRIAGSELGSGRGGPRCLSCPVLRDPLGAAG